MVNIPALLSYILLSAFTPGPNNIMAMSSAARVGFKKTFPFCLGVLIGFLCDMTLCAVFTSLLFAYIPAVMPVMRWVGAAYILFLAITILLDRPSKRKAESLLRPGGFVTGIVMQFVNVKVILYGITALSNFILPHTQAVPALALAVVGISLNGFIATSCWALFGSLFQRLFERYRKPMNVIMALLLAACAVMSLL